MVNAKNGHQSNGFKLSNAELDGKDGITDADIEAVVKIIMSK